MLEFLLPRTTFMASSTTMNLYTPSLRPTRIRTIRGRRAGVFRRSVVCCSAIQESSASSAVAETKASEPPAAAEAAKPAAKAAPPKKPPAKPLPEMMEEDVIPSLRATLEAQEDLSEIDISFQDNRLEGSFLKKDKPYYFWAFFPNGLQGPKGFSLSSFGTEASTVEPFLVDEKRITARLVVFWVEKRLAAQGILPVWKE